MGDLTTLAQVKEYLGISQSAWDAILTTLVSDVSADIEGKCYRTFTSATYTHYFDGRWQRTLQLPQYPVTSVTSVHDDAGRTFESASLVPTTDYYVDGDTGILHFINFRPSRGTKSLKVVYTAGYSTIPRDLKLLCHRRIASIFNRRKSDGSANESLGNYSTSYNLDWTPEELDVIARYMKIEESF